MKILQFPDDAFIVTTAKHELYDAVPSVSPIVLTGAAPTGQFKCRVKVSISGAHSDLVGHVYINSEDLNFTAGVTTKQSTTLLTSIPTVSYSGLDCNILIECVDSGGADIKSETATATKIQFENTSSGFFNASGVWTVYSGSYAMCKDVAAIGDVIRYGSIDMPIKKVDVEKWFSKILYYIFYL